MGGAIRKFLSLSPRQQPLKLKFLYLIVSQGDIHHRKFPSVCLANLQQPTTVVHKMALASNACQMRTVRPLATLFTAQKTNNALRVNRAGQFMGECVFGCFRHSHLTLADLPSYILLCSAGPLLVRSRPISTAVFAQKVRFCGWKITMSM